MLVLANCQRARSRLTGVAPFLEDGRESTRLRMGGSTARRGGLSFIISSHHRLAYRPPAVSSSSWVPRSTTRPSSRTTISSTYSSPVRRWVMSRVERPR